jgi:hypothetical protein
MHVTLAEVARYIDDFLAGSGGRWDWDDFISIPLEDPELEVIRKQCAALPDRYPPTQPRQYCSQEGLAELRRLRATLLR